MVLCMTCRSASKECSPLLPLLSSSFEVELGSLEVASACGSFQSRKGTLKMIVNTGFSVAFLEQIVALARDE